MRIGWLASLLIPLLSAMPGYAVDLKKIERRILTEPEYETSSPRYCLLVFGPKAKTRVWLVRDGNVLHFDRNSNGILGEPGEQATKSRYGSFKITNIVKSDDGKSHHSLKVYNRSGGEYRIYLSGKTPQYVGFSVADKPRFSSRPADAPIIHFNGPLTLGRYAKPVALEPNPRSKSYRVRSLRLMVGTPGLGKGTFAALHCRCRRKKGALVAEFRFPPKTKADPPISMKVTLKTYG